MYLHLPLGFFLQTTMYKITTRNLFMNILMQYLIFVNRCNSTTRTFLLTKHGKKNYFIFLIPKKYF